MQVTTRLGLTGGIGSGKSTVAAMLSELGAAVIDADAISRQTTAALGAAIAPIRAAFGDQFIDAQGALDREAMRVEVFAKPDARRQLEAIIHPLVAQETSRQEQQALANGPRVIVFDVPLLVESHHWRWRVNRVVVVDCTPEVQIQRTALRSGLAAADIAKIMATQVSREVRLNAADAVICNTFLSLEMLKMEVAEFASRFGL
jgi:dephospho-CoA kinase